MTITYLPIRRCGRDQRHPRSARLIEIMDARKEPSTPTMTIHLDVEYAIDRDKAREVSWQIEAAPLHEFGDIVTDMANMKVEMRLNPQVWIRGRSPWTRSWRGRQRTSGAAAIEQLRLFIGAKPAVQAG